MEFNSDLHSVLSIYETQMYVDKEGIQFIVFIPFAQLENFTETLRYSDFDDGGIFASLVHRAVCISLRDLFEWNNYRLKDYKECFSEEDFYQYENEIKIFDGES